MSSKASPKKSVTFNPLVSVASTNDVDQAAEMSLASMSATTFSNSGALQRTLSSILVTSANTANKISAANVSHFQLPIISSSSSSSCDTTAHIADETRVPQHVTFHQLQTDIQKCMEELDYEEALFLEQVKKVNNQDKALATNNKTVEKLQSQVETLRNDQNQINDAIVYLRDQQAQMEVLLSRLETSLPDIHPEMATPRRHLYELSHGIGQELLQMETDLEFVMEQISEPKKFAAENNQAVTSILQILNAHTDILEWVEDNCDHLKTSLQNVQTQHNEAVMRTKANKMEDLV